MPAKLQSCHFRNENQIPLCFVVRPTNHTLKQTKRNSLLPDKKKKGKKLKKLMKERLRQRTRVPAVHNNRSCFWGIEKLHLTNEAQEARGIARNPVVRPAGEVELPNLSDLMVAFLRRQHSLYFSSIRLQSLPLSLTQRAEQAFSSHYMRERVLCRFSLWEISSWTPITNEVGNTQLRRWMPAPNSNLWS